MMRVSMCFVPVSGLTAIALTLGVGCAPDAAGTKSPPKDVRQAAAGPTTGPLASDEATPPVTGPELIPQESLKPATPEAEPHSHTPPAKTADTPNTQPQSEPSPPTANAAVEEPENRGKTIVLGADELTAGIPGEGPLSVEQIRAWLDKPENHEPLAVVLPHGLDRAQKNIVIPADNPMTRAKIELGRQLYFDTRLCADNTVSCASCHDPSEGFTRHTQFGVGINGQEGGRNSPVSYNRILSGTQFWDGRAASLEEQAKGPIANPIEMGNTHEKAVETIGKIEGYRLQFERIFGTDGVTIDNIARAIATFERSIATGPAPYDYDEDLRPFKRYSQEDLDDLKIDDPDSYAIYEQRKKAAEEHPLSESASRGRELFFSEKVGCTACHAGANFTDEKYHNLGVGMDQPKPDLGRADISKDPKDTGAFKTPTVRNVELTAPYMHDGSQKTLEEVVEWYARGGHANPHLSDKVKKLALSAQDKKDLVEFMKACTGSFPRIATGRLPQ